MNAIKVQRDISNKGAWTSLLIGGPIGVVTIFVFFFGVILLLAQLSGEGLPGMGFYFRFRFPSIGMACALVISLWFTGGLVERCLLNKQGLLLVSLKYSAVTNIFIWTCFALVDFVANYPGFDIYSGLLLPLIMGLISTVLSSFTIGLLICYIIRKRLRA